MCTPPLQKYFFSFVMCEIFNMVLLFFNFWAVDQFLQGRFRYYGYQVQPLLNCTVPDQLCTTHDFYFPKMVSWGPGGRVLPDERYGAGGLRQPLLRRLSQGGQLRRAHGEPWRKAIISIYLGDHFPLILVQTPLDWPLRQGAVAQRALRAVPERHQREDLPCALVLPGLHHGLLPCLHVLQNSNHLHGATQVRWRGLLTEHLHLYIVYGMYFCKQILHHLLAHRPHLR